MPRRVLVDGARLRLLPCGTYTRCEAMDVEPVADGTIVTARKLMHQKRRLQLLAAEHQHMRELYAAREAAVGVPQVLQMEERDRSYRLLPRELLRKAKSVFFGRQVIPMLLEDIEHLLRGGPVVEADIDELRFSMFLLNAELR